MPSAISRRVSFFEQLRLTLLSQQWFTSILFKMPRFLRWTLRSLYFAPLDLADHLSGRKDPTVPPRWINFTGAVTDLPASREELKHNLIKFAGLQPTCRILEIGCGFGRLAVAMATYLDKDGAYHGIDIVRSAIKWCGRSIHGPHGNITFSHADIINAEYNPRGHIPASKYKIQAPDESYDIVVLVSVFTHMLPTEVDHYLSEIARVLKPGGRCYATYSIITEQAISRMSSGVASLNFRYQLGDCWVMNTSVPELGVGYEESYLRHLHASHNLKFDLHCGNWSLGLGPGSQDIIVARRI
ncbi:MAG: class I SAM-dependent methyltransferase [Alphaproteobacteria bacterium]|nr:class I SAM-dependent methyltransferase [Alphaproteobacteria bacterium]